VDINQLISENYAYEQIVEGIFDLLEICGCDKILVLNPANQRSPKYRLEFDSEKLTLTLQREDIMSKFLCSRYSRAVTVNGHPIRENDRRFLKSLAEILVDVQHKKALLFTPNKEH